MSEGVAAAGGAPASAPVETAAPVQSQVQGSGGKAPSTPSQAKASPSSSGAQATLGKDSPAGATSKDAASPKEGEATTEEELEEIQLGSVKTKLGKEAAKAVKDLLKGFNSKSQENAAIRKAIEAARANPDKFFEMSGLNPDEYTEARLAKKLQQLSMTPEQRKMQELEQFKAQRDAEDQQRQQREQQEHLTRAEQAADKSLRDNLLQAWKGSGLPADPRFGAWMASTMMQAQAQGLDWTWEQCASRVKEDFSSHTRETLTKLEMTQLRELLGDDVLKKIREDDVRRVTGSHSAPRQSSQTQRPDQQSASGQGSSGKRMLSESEYRKFFES